MARLRYELTDKEWLIIEPLLPNKPRGVPHAMLFAFWHPARRLLSSKLEAGREILSGWLCSNDIVKME